MSLHEDMELLKGLRKHEDKIPTAHYALGIALLKHLEEHAPTEHPQDRARMALHLSMAMYDTSNVSQDASLAVWSNALAVVATHQEGLEL